MERVNFDGIELDEFERHLLNGKPFTGEVIETDIDGNIIELTPVSDGWEDGIQRSWYSNGRLKFEGTTRRKTPVGTARWWHPNGELAEEREFDDVGHMLTIKRWDDDGTLLLEERKADFM